MLQTQVVEQAEEIQQISNKHQQVVKMKSCPPGLLWNVYDTAKQLMNPLKSLVVSS